VKILYIDMDNVLVNFKSGISRISHADRTKFRGRLDDVPGIFALMDPLPDAIESVERLTPLFDTYVLSTAPWENPTAWSDKLEWVKRHLGDFAYKRLILSHHKNLNLGDFLVDDRTNNGADRFSGEHIHFGSDAFPSWPSVVNYLLVKTQA
jgi:5'(3')-deoxyribonucleotidase